MADFATGPSPATGWHRHSLKQRLKTCNISSIVCKTASETSLWINICICARILCCSWNKDSLVILIICQEWEMIMDRAGFRIQFNSILFLQFNTTNCSFGGLSSHNILCCLTLNQKKKTQKAFNEWEKGRNIRKNLERTDQPEVTLFFQAFE